MKIAHLIRFVFALLVPFALATAGLAESGKITLKTAARVSGPIACLGEVAVVDVADPILRNELIGLHLSPAPSAGQSSYLTINDIRSILSAHGYSSNEIAIAGSSRVRLEAESIADEANAEEAPIRKLPRRSFGGKFLPAPSEPEVITVAHVVRNVRRGEIIQPSDVEMRELSVVRREEAYPTSLENIVGKEAARGISADRPIGSKDVREPIVVRRNEVVTVFARAGNIIVRREMLALNDAGKGELVEVQPISPQTFGRARESERFQAQVVGPGEAVVLTGYTQVQPTRPLPPIAPQGVNR
ncbi:flagellar basal body P-ring formation chaperone FlgA [Blastopirellula marina]|uniref:Flagella basal body P-ring formation protein FlgA n=1 Tax=Blastopirellula marina TaxID=124 RepID=A0A2S8FNJ6_9BACT|nr:flagellar basal body P-ring formation chaperone FlgA [Blastopirellula marina]PQO33768.1 flagella basal body P-ring formation protein FlgA [Blastopirellula marina]PTL43555.1 flagella basal body P-ring formation protein FlgA [Blastopirellula marina]